MSNGTNLCGKQKYGQVAVIIIHRIQVVPFARWLEVEITAAFNHYQKDGNDKRAHLIKLGDAASYGIAGLGVEKSWCSYDQTHPGE